MRGDMRTIYLSLVLVFILSGCASEPKSFRYSVNAARFSPAYDSMMERYDSVKAIAETRWDSFTEEEQKKLNLISNSVRLIESRINRIRMDHLDGMEGEQVTLSELGYIYTLAKDAYEKSHEIAMNHIGELSVTEILTLQGFDTKLKELNDEIKSMTISPSYNDADTMLYNMLYISSAALKIILPIVIGREMYNGQEQFQLN